MSSSSGSSGSGSLKTRSVALTGDPRLLADDPAWLKRAGSRAQLSVRRRLLLWCPLSASQCRLSLSLSLSLSLGPSVSVSQSQSLRVSVSVSVSISVSVQHALSVSLCVDLCLSLASIVCSLMISQQ